MNHTIKKLLDDNKISKKEYDILFEDKADWLKIQYKNINIEGLSDTENNNLVQSSIKMKDYDNALNNVIQLQSESDKIDLNYIQFINYNFRENFDTVVSFSNCKFYGITSFMLSTFGKKELKQENVWLKT